MPVNLAYAQQAGQAYTYAYLEASLNDMLFRFFDAARNPTIPVKLPGASKVRTPIIYPPHQWAGLMLVGFRALVEELRSPARFQAFTFRMESQPRTPYPLYRTTKMDRAEGDDERRRPPPAPAARRRPDRAERTPPLDRKKPPSADARTCFFSVLREYKLAANTSLVSEDNREALIAKITADKRIKYAAGGAATGPSHTLTTRPPLPLLPSDLACIASTLHQVNTFASVLNLHTSLDQQALDAILTEAFVAASGEYGIRAAQEWAADYAFPTSLLLRDAAARLHSTFGTEGTLVPGLDPFDFAHLVV
ncbi:hypothetical protein B484DRAFT_410586, partial [Ochromonadaceae sp. CCMP2298]